MRQPIHPISEIAIIGVYGFVLKAVQPGSAAQQAGLRVGDVITSLNDQALISMEEFQKQIHFSAPGTLFQIKYLRYNTRSGSLEESQTSSASQAIETLQAVFRH
jgi:S1-C subfamily serine protease